MEHTREFRNQPNGDEHLEYKGGNLEREERINLWENQVRSFLIPSSTICIKLNFNIKKVKS